MVGNVGGGGKWDGNSTGFTGDTQGYERKERREVEKEARTSNANE
jgi:hypothetical protein